MPKSELGVAVDLLRKSTKKRVVVGFGYSRNRTDDPWFRRSDVINVLSPHPASHLIMLSVGGYSMSLTEFEDKGIAEIRTEKRGQGKHARLARVTDLGEEALLEAIVYNVTHDGLTVPQLLFIPEVTETVLHQSDLKTRVTKAVFG